MPDAAVPDPASSIGAIAQLGERLDGIQEVVGSIPTGSTNPADSYSCSTYTIRDESS
jgi:hypothetical protein